MSFLQNTTFEHVDFDSYLLLYEYLFSDYTK